MINWLNQVFSVAFFSVRTIPSRWGASISAAMGIAGVVAVLVGVLAIAEGFRKAMTSAGFPDVAIVLRTGADNELTSGLSRDEVRVIRDAPGVLRGTEGPVLSGELFVIISLPKRTTGTDANVPLRGVENAAYEVRGNIEMVEGRRFEPGKNEIIVGTGAARSFAGLETGKQIRIGQNTWTVTGVFTAGGGVAESEIWCDAAVLMPAYQREGFQAVYARLDSPVAFREFKDNLTQNPQLKVKTSTLKDFYAEQSSMLTEFITNVGSFIAGMMALGALFGALNTMYGAVSSRTREIATLRALGFSGGPVVLSVLAESIVLSVVGGSVGAVAAYLAFDGFQASTLNWQTFSQVTFAFAVTPALLQKAIIWAAVLGVLGGLFPAIRAARLPIATALRET
ncbi:MAG TPA: ABC transporter permease [Prosthecobacter sp.]|nr:ABC transporter permease [Prosthecobacter sp.]